MANFKQITVAKCDKYQIPVCKAQTLKVKSILLLFFVYLAGISSSFGQLAALQKAPATAAPGSSFIVKISINRSSINGFMKLSQDLPPGYSAVEMDSKSGDFRFENNETKIIWLKAPVEVTYTATYKILVPKNATGSLSLGGEIIFVTNKNERKVFKLPVKKIIISGKPEKPISQPAESKNKNNTEINSTSKKNKEKNTETKSLITSEKSTTIATNTSNNKHNALKKKFGFRKGGLEPDVLVKTENVSANQGNKFKVQIGAFRQSVKIKNVPEHSTIIVDDVTKHFSGNFSTYEAAAERKKQMIEQGFKDAFIVSFPDNTSTDKVLLHVCKNWWHCLKLHLKN